MVEHYFPAVSVNRYGSCKTVLEGIIHTRLVLLAGITMTYPHTLSKAAQLILQRSVFAKQVLDDLITALLAAQVLYFSLEALDVFLCAGPNGPLSLTVIGALP